MEDVLEIYKRPYNSRYPVVCMDESNKQLKISKAEEIPSQPGKTRKIETRYESNGVSNIFLSFEPLAGKRFVTIAPRRRRLDWAAHIQHLVENIYAKAERIILIVDNLNIHTGAALYETLPPQRARKILDKLEIHYTPKHGSWLHIAEIELSHLARQCINRRIGTQQILAEEVAFWCKERNQWGAAVNWQFTTQEARIKLKKLYPDINNKVKINEM